MTRSSAPLKASSTALAAVLLGTTLLAGCGQTATDQEQAAAIQAAADRAEAAAVRAEKAAGIATKENSSSSNSNSSDSSVSTSEDGAAVAGPPEPTEEDVQRALDEAGR